MDDNWIELLGYIILGLVQGIAEVFPISSSAHLAMTRDILHATLGFRGFSFQAAIFLHIGTFIAILLWYQRDVVELWQGFSRSVFVYLFRLVSGRTRVGITDPNARVAFRMLASLLTTAILGKTLQTAAGNVFDSSKIISAFLIVNGIILLASTRLPWGKKKIQDIELRDFILIGAAQGIAVLPGISRFGMTLCACLARGLSWYEALKLSFLLSLPTVLGATLLEGIDYVQNGGATTLNSLYLLLAIVISAIIGYISIRFLLIAGLHMRRRLVYFGVYSIVVGFYGVLIFNWLLPTS
ncbi:MAG: undecaprenyl-diphosphate phosphatase [Chloroflexota bacterium]|nr:undecaprenyl-diphosphate phosphatase [Chloroflexota bacterium]MDQ5867096.1 undecaprenyl-diphosphate phosphatase [Chloroflexota bacterium]